MIMLQNKEIHTPYGVFGGVISEGFYEDGSIKDIRLCEKNMILTHAGELVPFYGDETPRRKHKASVSFHENGMIRAVFLEEQQDVMTPIGEFPAELVTFYDSGELKRIFPLDGKISGFWSEEDERGLNIPFSFEFDFASFTAMLVGICFYKSGEIKSLTLFPGELVTVNIPEIGNISVKNGFSLYKSGKLKSLEPDVPVAVKTPIGEITAFDPGAIGVNADTNSLRFDEEGRICGLVTDSDNIAIIRKDGSICIFAPMEAINPIDNETTIILPIRVTFNRPNNEVTLEDADGRKETVGSDENFVIYKSGLSGCSGKDCKSCSHCSLSIDMH
jgi:hypothetical protein